MPTGAALSGEFDHFRRGVVCEPRGSEVCRRRTTLQTSRSKSAAAVIFFNDVGYLGMCGHGTIGLITTLAHMGRIGPGQHRIETPAGTVSNHLHEDGRVSVSNVSSYRLRASVPVDVPGYAKLQRGHCPGRQLVLSHRDHPFALSLANRAELVAASTATRSALIEACIPGEAGGVIDHIEFFSAPRYPEVPRETLSYAPSGPSIAHPAAPEQAQKWRASTQTENLLQGKPGSRKEFSAPASRGRSPAPQWPHQPRNYWTRMGYR